MAITNAQPEYGTSGHAELITQGRHPGVQAAMAWLAYHHLPEHLRQFSQDFYALAAQLIQYIPTDGPELIDALDLIIKAKDSAMRAGIRHQTGRPGSVPRPQETVDPPHLGQPLIHPGTRQDAWSPSASPAADAAMIQVPAFREPVGEVPPVVQEMDYCPNCSRSNGVPHASWCTPPRR